MKILVCGGREYHDRLHIGSVLSQYSDPDNIIITGGAPGADAIALEWAEAKSLATCTFPAQWDRYPNRKAAGPMRNQRMLDEGKPDLVVAFPGGAGTADMVRRAKAAGVPVVEVVP